MTGEERTPDNHPFERASDAVWRGRVKNWWGAGRGYRDVWLTAITALVVVALMANSDRVDQINQERANNIERECEQTNARNRQTKDTLIKAAAADIAKAEENARNRQQNPELFRNEIEGRRDVTLALIDALAPHQNCKALVNQSVSDETGG